MGVTTDTTISFLADNSEKMSCYIPQHTHTERKREILPPDVAWVWELQPGGYQTCLTLGGAWGQGRLSLHVVLDCHHLLPSVRQAWTLIPRQYLDSDNDLCSHTKASWWRKHGGASQSERWDATGWREQNVNSQQGLFGGKRKNVSIIDWLAFVHHVRGQKIQRDKKIQHLFILKIEVFI